MNLMHLQPPHIDHSMSFTINSIRTWGPKASRRVAQWLSPLLGPVLQNGRQDGPPDLDELWKDLNKKLSNMFGGSQNKDSGPSNSDPSSSPKSNGWMGIVLVVAIALLIWLGSGIFIVQEGQRGVILSFGRFSHTVEAGLQWRWPYPFQSHEVVNMTQLQSVEIGDGAQSTGLRDSSMLTQDENIVDIRFTVQYRLSDARDYLFENRDPNQAVVLAAESAVREIVGKNTTDSVLYEQRDAIAVELVKSIQSQLDKLKAGIYIANVNVRSVEPPEQVKSAFEDAVKASADRERFKNEGQSYANDILPKAQGMATRLREEATGYAGRVVAQAEGDSDRFKSVLTEYQKAPAVTRDRLYIDTMQQVYSNVSKVLVDTKNNSNLLYMPLDKLINSVNAGPANNSVLNGVSSANPAANATSPSPDTSVPTPSAATVSPDPRTRDASRGRERDVR